MNTALLDFLHNDFVHNSAQIYMDELLIRSHSFLPPETIKKKALYTGEKDALDMMKKIENGWLVFEQQGKRSSSIQPIINKINDKRKRIGELNGKEEVLPFLMKSFKVNWGTQAHEREELYQISKTLLTGKQWEDAHYLYFLFTLLFPKIPEFWLCLGITEEQFNCTDTAFYCFLQAHLLNPMLIDPCLYIAECSVFLGDYSGAKDALDFLGQLIENQEYDSEIDLRVSKLKEKVNGKI